LAITTKSGRLCWSGFGTSIGVFSISFRRVRPVAKGPRGERRPTDVVGRAVQIMRIATGEEAEDLGPVDDGKDPAAKAMGKKGGAARAKALTPEKRQEIAHKAARTRWNKLQ
jgi:hypothetical protein